MFAADREQAFPSQSGMMITHDWHESSMEIAYISDQLCWQATQINLPGNIWL